MEKGMIQQMYENDISPYGKFSMKDLESITSYHIKNSTKKKIMNYTFEKGYVLKDGVKMPYAEVIDELHLLRLKADKLDELEDEVSELYSFIDTEADLETVGEICATKLGYI